jgi:hypothetical protein
MTNKQFFDAVAALREIQKEYRWSHKVQDYVTLIELEKKIDKEIETVKAYMKLHPELDIVE